MMMIMQKYIYIDKYIIIYIWNIIIYEQPAVELLNPHSTSRLHQQIGKAPNYKYDFTGVKYGIINNTAAWWFWSECNNRHGTRFTNGLLPAI